MCAAIKKRTKYNTNGIDDGCLWFNNGLVDIFKKWVYGLEWRLGDSLGISDRGTKAKIITSCDNAFVTNILLPQAAHRTPPGSSVRKRSVSNKCFICAKVKRQQQMFYLCESEAAATNVLSVRKRSGSKKAPGLNWNQPLALQKSILYFLKNRWVPNAKNFIRYFLSQSLT